jgi:hypothetical protein
MKSRAKAKDSQAQAQSEGGAPKSECLLSVVCLGTFVGGYAGVRRFHAAFFTS